MKFVSIQKILYLSKQYLFLFLNNDKNSKLSFNDSRIMAISWVSLYSACHTVGGAGGGLTMYLISLYPVAIA